MSSTENIEQLSLSVLHKHIDFFCGKSRRIKEAYLEIAYPSLYVREPGFETLVKIILGQQVSLASALSAYLKLEEQVGVITPRNLAALSMDTLKACYLSKQKSTYIHALCNAILSGTLNLEALTFLSDEVVKSELMKVKGIGAWTAEVYLAQALRRMDVFPLGDLAAINGLKAILKIEAQDELVRAINRFKPYRTSLLFFAWHYYIYKKKLKIVL